MQNVAMKVEGTKLIITVDLAASGAPSKTGKSIVVASTHGNAPIPGTQSKIGLNIFKPV